MTTPKTRFFAVAFGTLGLLAAACGDADVGSDEQNATSIPFAEGSPEGRAVLAVANDRSLDELAFDEKVGLHAKAAANLVRHRDGADLESPDDDNPFDDLAELWSVKYCKSSCFYDLLDYAKETGVFQGNDGISVVFSPQPTESTHLAKIAEWIDNEADETIDIAMYSYSHSGPVRAALERAVNRGVKIRFLADTALADSSSKGGALEELGIDVRRTTKTMHHKFCIIDGPRDNASLDRAGSAHVISGSGNWSSSAGTMYDENTLFITGSEELALRMQRDFDYLWSGSKDKVWNDTLVWDQTRADITDDLIAEVEDPNTHVYFTSANFTVNNSGSWSYLGTTEVTDQLVGAILGADQSIDIASGHFLSTPIVTAVRDALQVNPNLDVRVVLDCQEANAGGNIATLKDEIVSLGGSINYKCTTYRWHYKYAKQLHHKYIIIDGEELWTGSLNFSDNSETNVFENMMYFAGPEHQELIAAYQDNHQMVESYGAENGGAALEAVMQDIQTGSSIPLIWDDPITMDGGTWTGLKSAIRSNCPATVTWVPNPAPGAKTYDKHFTQQPQWFTHCSRYGYPWPNVPENMRID